MTDAPDKIALRWETGAAVTNGPLMTHPDYTQFTRADLCADPALLAEAVEVLRDAVAAWDLHNETGDMMQGHWAGDARAFLAKWENRNDR